MSTDAEKIKSVFRRFDTSNDKGISKTELRRILQLITQAQVEDDSLNRILAIADSSGDGVINYEEFVHWVFSSNEGKWLESEGIKLMDKPEPSLTSKFGKLHVLIVEGSSHPGRLLNDNQFMGLPLHFDLLFAAFDQIPTAVVKSRVSPKKAEVDGILRQFASSIPDGDVSFFIFTGHGVQARGEQYLVFESTGGEQVVSVKPLCDDGSGKPYAPGEFRVRERMMQIDRQMSASIGPDWLARGWTISCVDGVKTTASEYNHAVVEAGRHNQPFDIVFSKGEKTIDFLSYDKLRDIFAGGRPSVHFIDACRVVHDDALGFKSEEKSSDAVSSRDAFVLAHPCPSNVVSVFAAKPGVPAMHEGAGRNYDKSKMELGHEMEAEGILQSSYAKQIEQAWADANAKDGMILQYYTSFFVEAFVQCLGELHLEGETATVGDLLKRMTCCRFGRMRKMRGFRTFIGDNPVLETGKDESAVDSFAIRFQGKPFVVPEVEDE